MKNHKHALLMTPDKQFEVLQSQDGNALFFSIGTDGAFYITRELPQDLHGWSRFNVNKSLQGTTIIAKAFDVSQNIAKGTVDIALAVTIDKVDILYAALGLPNTDAAWAAAIDAGTLGLQSIAFDDHSNTAYGSCPISDVNVSVIGGSKFIVVDIIKDTNANLVFRYFVDPTKAVMGNNTAWNPRDLAINLNAGTIQTFVGRRDGAPVDGVYTFGSIGGTQELIYTPLYDYDNKKIAPSAAKLPLPANSTAMALSANSDDLTDVFVAAGGSLWFLDDDSQDGDSDFTSVYTHPLFNGVERLLVNNDGDQVMVWGLNEQGQVFYLQTAAGSESDSSSWSYPVVILDNAELISSYRDAQRGSVILFANLNNNTQVQLNKDILTGHWSTRAISLPTPKATDIINFYSFTTHMELQDDNKLALANTAVSITATENCTVYINNVYHRLFANTPLQIQSDPCGVITILQSIETIAGVCFSISGANADTVVVNPMMNVIAKLTGVAHKEDLDVDISDEQGNTKKLLDPSVGDEDREAYANLIQDFVKENTNMPKDGSQLNGGLQAAMATTPGNAAGANIRGIRFAGGKAIYFNSLEAAAGLGVKLPQTATAAASTGLLGSSNGIEIVAGDAWNWLKGEYENVTECYLQAWNGFTHFFITIGKELYHFALKCVKDIAHGLSFLFNKLKIIFEDIVKWIGFIFAWKDIVRTHQVMKNIMIQYIKDLVTDLDGLQLDLDNAFATIENDINGWAGLPTSTDTYANNTGNVKQNSDISSPSSNHGTYHMKNNAANGDSSTFAPDLGTTDVADVLQTLIDKITASGDEVKAQVASVKDIISSLPGTDIGTILKRLTAILADTMITAGKIVLDAFLAAIELLVEGYLDSLTAPIFIPVISQLYQDATGDDLTLLDGFCLAAAIPATIVYKIATGNAPFPDNDTTTQLANATDLDTIQQIINPVNTSLQINARGMLLGSAPSGFNDILTFTSNCAALVGSVLLTIFQTMKAKGDTTAKTAWLCGVSYIPYVMPDIANAIVKKGSGEWYDIMNEIMTGIALLKAGADISGYKKDYNLVPGEDNMGFIDEVPKYQAWGNVSPLADAIINIIWQIPVVGGFIGGVNWSDGFTKDNINTLLQFIGNTAFDGGGWFAPELDLAVKSEDDKVIAAALALNGALNVSYGALMAASSLDTL